MKKKAIEKIPYLGLRKISSKEEVKYRGNGGQNRGTRKASVPGSVSK